MESVFTKIIKGELSGRIVWSDDVCVVMVDIRPLNRGHALVIPKQQIDHWVDLDSETVAHLNRVAQHIGRAQMSIFACERIGLMIAGFEVPHTHLHVVPISSMDHLDFQQAKPASEQELDSVSEALREALIKDGHSEVV